MDVDVGVMFYMGDIKPGKICKKKKLKKLKNGLKTFFTVYPTDIFTT